ncbi:hypothetical protein [uncultured Jatrophihabitans sp.]|uniref:hypothetical protein n=1 Tax=uncultured Jatrophihabitans sp. TaxID=1610747 RepID=UPI0035CB6ED7
MGALPLATRARLIALAATSGAAAVLVAVGSPTAAAAPSTQPAPSSTSSSTPQSSATPASTAASTSPATRQPAATAPPTPPDYGPPCTTNADKSYPVVCLPEGTGEDRTASVTPGEYLEFDAQVVNNGPAVSDATVVITLPSGLGLESDEPGPVYRIDGWFGKNKAAGQFTDLTCQGDPSTVTCSVGALPTHANILVAIDLEVSTDATANSTLTFGVVLQPAGTNVYPPTSVSARVNVLERSRLVVSLTPATLRTIVGHRASITGIVHNLGPGPAPDTVAVALALGEKHPSEAHFTITNGSDASVLGGGLTALVFAGPSPSLLRAQLQQQPLRRAASSAQRHALPSARFWPLDTIAPGATARVVVQLKALRVGTDTLTFGALSPAVDAECGGEDESGSGSSSAVASATPLDRMPVATTTTAPGDCSLTVQTKITAIPTPAAAAPLANTGSQHLETLLGVAFSASVLGALFMWAGRRRVAGRRHG